MKPEQVTERICAVLPDAQLELTGSDCSFGLLVVSESFTGQSAVARQRMLLGLFAAELAAGQLHALSINAKTPAEIAAETRAARVGSGTRP